MKLMPMRKRPTVAILVVGIAWATLAVPAAAQTQPYSEGGYIEMPDGVTLKYRLYLPSDGGRYPVALIYDGYCEGSDPLTCNDPIMARALLEAGYAVLGVSIRGTGCSGGSWHSISRQWGKDGAHVVEWAATQTWSIGRVGMFGMSFPALTQFATAPFRPKGLAAIAPYQPTTDFYRDVMFPGGIFNSGFMGFWGLFNQPYGSVGAIAADADESGCRDNIAGKFPGTIAENVFLTALREPFYNKMWREAMPDTHAHRIDVPALVCVTWQDDEVSARMGSTFDKLDPDKTWIVGSNGYHSQCDRSNRTMIDMNIRFFDRFLKGDVNAFDLDTPHVQIWHETSFVKGNNTPAWITSHPSWPVAVDPATLYLQEDGTLGKKAPQRLGSSKSYAYPGPSTSTEEGVVFGQDGRMWDAPVPEGSWLAFTTPALDSDVEFFGPASANIWLSSTAPDTDLQVTLTEVTPDGDERYVIRGWLRMSHRALDKKCSTKLRPFHPHTRAASLPLAPNEPVLGRVEIFPFNHVFRAGSHIRLLIEAPTGETGGWSFDYLKTPGVNTVHLDKRYTSSLVLGRVPGGRALAPAPECDGVRNQPCRANPIPVPNGSVDLSSSSGTPKSRSNPCLNY